jgi:hypothetical protein
LFSYALFPDSTLASLSAWHLVVCQALLWIYTEQDEDKWRKVGLRSAFEIINLWNAFTGTNQADRDKAVAIIRLLASQLTTDEMAVRNIIEEVARDPYSDFVYKTWVPNI